MAARKSKARSILFPRTNILLLLFFCLLGLAPPIAHACMPAPVGSAVHQHAFTLEEEPVAHAEVLFIGVVDEVRAIRGGERVTYLVLKGIRGVRDGERYQSPVTLSASCERENKGEIWLHFRTPAKAPTPPPPLPTAYRGLDLDTGNTLTHTQLAADWQENWNRQFQPTDGGYLLRDACGKSISNVHSGAIKKAYGFDIHSITRFDLAQTRTAAEKHNSEAQRELSVYYQCKGDSVSASLWSTRAELQDNLRKAKEGDVAAHYRLGMLYARGATGITRNPSEAIKWLTVSALKSNSSERQLSQQLLTTIYLEGNGIPQDKVEALFWLALRIQESHGNQRLFRLCHEPPVFMNPGISMKAEGEMCKALLDDVTAADIENITRRVQSATQH